MQQIGQWLMENQVWAVVIGGWMVYAAVAVYKLIRNTEPTTVAQKRWAGGIGAVLLAAAAIAATGEWDWAEFAGAAIAAWGMATGIHAGVEKPLTTTTSSTLQQRLDAARRTTLPILVALAVVSAVVIPVQVLADDAAKISLEAGVGVGLISEQDFTAQVGINFGELPQSWWLVGGHEAALYVGKTGGGPWFVAPEIGIAPNTRLGVPIWREGDKPMADVAIFYTQGLNW